MYVYCICAFFTIPILKNSHLFKYSLRKITQKKAINPTPFKQAKMCGSVHASCQVLREVEFTIICYTKIRLDFVFMYFAIKVNKKELHVHITISHYFNQTRV